MGIRCVDDILNKAFFRLGFIVGNHPGYFIIIPILLTLFFITGYQQIHYNIDPEYLFSPINGEGKLERRIAEDLFKVNYTSRFNVARISRAGRFGRVIITSKDGNRNMLRKEVWRELRLLDDIIQNATVFYKDEYFTYQDICAKWNNECFKNDILNLDYIIDEVEKGELNLTFPLMFNPVTWDAHAFPVFFGGTEISDEGFIIAVPSVQLVYFGNVDSKRLEEKGAAWEDIFLDIVGEAQDNGLFEHIRIARFASRTLDHELEKNTRSVIPYFSSTFVIMAIFSVVTCMMADWVRSKPWLGLLGNLSAAMATLSAFGLCMYIGIDFIGINLAAPFLMIGIGIDDTFVMLAAWRRTSMKSSVPERMAQMLSEAAVSITITSVTDMVSFFIGIFSPFPSVTIFCLYSGAATIFTFIWHLTFFSGCVAVAGYCEQKNLHSLFCFKVNPVSTSRHRSWFYKVFCSGGIAPNDIDNPLDNKEHGLMVFFRETFANFLNNRFIKLIVLLVFASYLVGAGYGITKIEEGLERRKVAKRGSYAIEFFDREDDYFREFPYRIQVIVSGEYDYSNVDIQQMVENLTQTFENTSYISNALYTESWLRSFIQYVERNQDYLNVSIDSPNSFTAALKEFELVRPMSIQNMVIGAIVMMIISFIFIPNFLCSLWVAFSIISIETGVVGYMALWKVNLDSISMINLIMCIGFSVDFTAHICYAYMSSKAKTSDERVKECLYALGLPIFQGSVSTILGMIALALADNYIFSVFFKMVFLVVFFGAMHGLFLLPVLLSLFGPGSCNSKSNNKNTKVSPTEKVLPHPFYIPHPQLNINPLQTTPKVKLQNSGDNHKMKSYREVDKDLGIGTSEENSSESSSNPSHNKQAIRDELARRIYNERWIREAGADYSQCEFNSSQVLDIYGSNTEKNWHKQNENAEENRRKPYEDTTHNYSKDRFDHIQRYRRRYSPPEQSCLRTPPLVRSSSYHSLQCPSYIKELRFP